jgi:hypothetical protein
MKYPDNKMYAEQGLAWVKISHPSGKLSAYLEPIIDFLNLQLLVCSRLERFYISEK